MSKAALDRLKSKLGLNTESNYIDATGSTTSTATLSSRIAHPTIPQGSGVGQRVGSSLRLTRLDLRINIANVAAMTSDTSVRILVVRNKANGGAQPADILQTTTNFASPIHHLFKEHELVLLWDEIVTVGTATSGMGPVNIVRSFTGENWHVQFDDTDTSGVLANVVEGAISVFWMLDYVSGAAPVFNSICRYHYVDN